MGNSNQANDTILFGTSESENTSPLSSRRKLSPATANQAPSSRQGRRMSDGLKSLSPELFFQNLHSIIHPHFPDHHISFTLILNQGNGSHCVGKKVHSNGSYVWEELEEEVLKGISAHCVRTKKPYYTNQAQLDPLICRHDKKSASHLVIPFCLNKQVVFLVNVSHEQGLKFSAKSVHQLENLLVECSDSMGAMATYILAQQMNWILLRKVEENYHLTKVKTVEFQSLDKWTFQGVSPLFKDHHEGITLLNKRPYGVHGLIQGEEGGGHELFVRYVHAHSEMSHRPLIKVSCSSLSHHEDITLSMIQNLMKGAQGGGVYFENIDQLSHSTQLVLLEFLQLSEKHHQRPQEIVYSMPRIYCSSKTSLIEKVLSGGFLEGLYYSLTSFSFKLKPLRERHEDFMAIAKELKPEAVPFMNGEFLDQLKSYPWPGNISEFLGALMAVETFGQKNPEAMCDIAQLPSQIADYFFKDFSHDGGRKNSSTQSTVLTLNALERAHIVLTLEKLRGNKTHAAKVLGITVKTLYNKLHNYEIL